MTAPLGGQAAAIAPAGLPPEAAPPGAALSPGQQVLGVLPGEPAVSPSLLPSGTPKEQYDFAYGLVLQLRYAEAEKALKEFIAVNGGNELVGNARFWLGQTYYVQSQYQEAAVTFFEAFQEAPQGTKGPDNLLKLAMSLARMDQKQEACATFAELGQRFPNAPANITEQAAAERTRLAC